MNAVGVLQQGGNYSVDYPAELEENREYSLKGGSDKNCNHSWFLVIIA